PGARGSEVGSCAVFCLLRDLRRGTSCISWSIAPIADRRRCSASNNLVLNSARTRSNSDYGRRGGCRPCYALMFRRPCNNRTWLGALFRSYGQSHRVGREVRFAVGGRWGRLREDFFAWRTAPLCNLIPRQHQRG